MKNLYNLKKESFCFLLIFCNFSLFANSNNFEQCQYLEKIPKSATNWNCYIKVTGYWADKEKIAMCSAHSSKEKEVFLAGTIPAKDNIIIRNTSFDVCQKKFEQLQELMEKRSYFGEPDLFHPVRTEIRERGPLRRFYYRRMSVNQIDCKFYEYRYQYYLF